MSSSIFSSLLFFSTIILLVPATKTSQVPTEDTSLLTRRYKIVEKLTYHMEATHRGHLSTTAYQIDATGVVKKNDAGNSIEEYAWVNLVRNDKPADPTPEMREFRQTVSLDPAVPPSVPNLSKLIEIVGPITDMLTFYADLSLATQLNKLKKPRDQYHFAMSTDKANSWADGAYVLIGEDAIEFDLTLVDLDLPNKLATLQVKHVPPAKPQIRIPAEWMRAPIADTANNWVELQKGSEGKYFARIGKETFVVQLKFSLTDGKILAGTIDNPVSVLERECEDLALTKCGDPVRYQILRQVKLTLQQ